MDSQTDTPFQDPALMLRRICRENGLAISDEQAERLRRYVDLLREWNAKINLVSRRDEDQIWTSHILHSLSILFTLDLPDGLKILDLGTGGGLPGIPIAILRGSLHISLLDSIQKKMLAVRDMVQRLGLSNVAVLTGRAEELAKAKEAAHTFDLVVARAVAPLPDLVRWSVPLLRTKPGTHIPHRLMISGVREFRTPLLLALKGGNLEAEIAQARLRRPALRVSEGLLVFRGSEDLGLEDKKIVAVEF